MNQWVRAAEAMKFIFDRPVENISITCNVTPAAWLWSFLMLGKQVSNSMDPLVVFRTGCVLLLSMMFVVMMRQCMADQDTLYALY